MPNLEVKPASVDGTVWGTHGRADRCQYMIREREVVYNRMASLSCCMRTCYNLCIMTGHEITLAQMLARREHRYHEQQSFLQKYHSPLVSFCMNIPGPIKTNQQIRRAFTSGRDALLVGLKKAGAVILEVVELHDDTGDELLLAVGNADPSFLKDIAVQIEEASPVGRRYDIDVLDAQGHKISRSRFRKCLICDKQAQDCARSRTHSVKEMQDAIDSLLEGM